MDVKEQLEHLARIENRLYGVTEMMVLILEGLRDGKHPDAGLLDYAIESARKRLAESDARLLELGIVPDDYDPE